MRKEITLGWGAINSENPAVDCWPLLETYKFTKYRNWPMKIFFLAFSVSFNVCLLQEYGILIDRAELIQ